MLVDKSDPEIARLAAKLHSAKKIQDAQKFMAKLKAKEREAIPEFLAFLEHEDNWTMDLPGMNLLWARWALNNIH